MEADSPVFFRLKLFIETNDSLFTNLKEQYSPIPY